MLRIAQEDGTDPKLVSDWLRRLGITTKQGSHRVSQPTLSLGAEVVELAMMGTAKVEALIRERVWGVSASGIGLSQLDKFCKFVVMHSEGKGVEETAGVLGVHRSTILGWRSGEDLPYLMKVAVVAKSKHLEPGWKILPIHLGSGGNTQSDWVEVPESIRVFDDLARVVAQLPFLQEAKELADGFGIKTLDEIRLDLVGYLLAMMSGDSSKSGGIQERFASMGLDLQLSLKRNSNERLGKYVCMCANTIGIKMKRISDKQPTGDSKYSQTPTGAYRWVSERSPLLAWMFSVCMGLGWEERTSYDPLKMDWIFSAPFSFRLRFVQGLADSDAGVKPSEVVVTSVPNAEFVTKLLLSLGMTSAHTIIEGGVPLRTMVNRREASHLPIFNEHVKGYRYDALVKEGIRPSKYGI